MWGTSASRRPRRVEFFRSLGHMVGTGSSVHDWSHTRASVWSMVWHDIIDGPWNGYGTVNTAAIIIICYLLIEHTLPVCVICLCDGFARLFVLPYPVHCPGDSSHQAQEAIICQGTVSVGGILWSAIFLLSGDWRADLWCDRWASVHRLSNGRIRSFSSSGFHAVSCQRTVYHGRPGQQFHVHPGGSWFHYIGAF